MLEWLDLEVGENKIAKMALKNVDENTIEVSIVKAIITFPVTEE